MGCVDVHPAGIVVVQPDLCDPALTGVEQVGRVGGAAARQLVAQVAVGFVARLVADLVRRPASALTRR